MSTDRETATVALGLQHRAYEHLEPFAQWAIDSVAAALANERAVAIRPFLGMLEELERAAPDSQCTAKDVADLVRQFVTKANR